LYQAYSKYNANKDFMNYVFCVILEFRVQSTLTKMELAGKSFL
jgi:hypothetical protein